MAAAGRPRLAGHGGCGGSGLLLPAARPTPRLRAWSWAPTPRAAAAFDDANANAPSTPPPPPPTTALLIEVDGALVDIVQQGHRVAFNRAFAQLGLPPQAAYATPRAFEAALRVGGTGEEVVAARLAEAGAWPTFLSGEGERRQFARRAHEAKQRLFADLIAAGDLPLRPDVAGVVDAALKAGAVVALLAETASAPEEGVSGAALRALGEERAAQVRVLTAGLRRRRRNGGDDDDGDDEDDDGGGNDEQGLLRLAVARQKAAAAREFKARFEQSVGGGASSSGGGGAAAIDVSALTAAAGEPEGAAAAAAATEGVSPAFLSAAALLLGASPARCACVAATGATVRAAAEAGMVSVAVPRQGALDATFSEAAAKFEGYGPGYLTWPRLAAMVEAAAAPKKAPPPAPSSSSR